MTVLRNRQPWRIAAAFLALAGSAVHAEWQPQWSATWQHPESFHLAAPLRMRVADSGETFAVVGVTHHQVGHVALMKFDAVGNFAWLNERAGGSLAGVVFTNDRVAIAGEWGTLAAPVSVSVYDAQTGDLVWDRLAAGRLLMDGVGVNARQQLAVAASGNLMVLASDQGDYVVTRFDPDGNALPIWRRPIDPNNDVLATGIIALPDGGAILTGQGKNLGGGYVTVRLDAQGSEVFTDVELGEIGNPLGPAYLALANDGGIVVAAAPESMDGVPRAQVWKLSSGGVRLWTRVAANTGTTTSGTMIQDLVLGPDGDAFTEVSGLLGPFRLLRLAAETGEVIWDVDVPILGDPTTLTLAPGGRVLVASRGGGQQTGQIAEFDAGGHPCRVANNPGMFSAVIAAAGFNGWSVLGATQSIPGSGNDALVSHFDGGGACTMTDLLFKDSFD